LRNRGELAGRRLQQETGQHGDEQTKGRDKLQI
jgi:hypothetical protein